MSFASGHANALERARVAELEAKLHDRRTNSDELFELALLNLEPLHDGFRAAELLQKILNEDSRHKLSKLWLTYVNIYELMDEDALRNAVRLSDQLIDQGASADVQAAALLLKATAVRGLGDQDPAEYVRASIALAPGWVANRQLLARIYQERGEQSAAEEELLKAIEACGQQPEPESFADRMFEMLVTARASHRITDRLKEQLRQLRT
jgi:tetratricopeptide (TPR) repeat protein